MVQINSYSPNKVKLLVHLMNKYTCNFISTWPYFIFFYSWGMDTQNMTLLYKTFLLSF